MPARAPGRASSPSRCASTRDPLGFFFDFTGAAKLEDGSAIPASLAADLAKGAEASADAYAQLADFLETELAPAAVEEDAIGRELYALHSRHFLGAEIDLDETYEWGIEELKRMVDEQTRIAGEIKPGASVEEAIEFLNAGRQPQAARHRRAPGLDAGAQRQGRRRARRRATSTSRTRSRSSNA